MKMRYGRGNLSNIGREDLGEKNNNYKIEIEFLKHMSRVFFKPQEVSRLVKKMYEEGNIPKEKYSLVKFGAQAFDVGKYFYYCGLVAKLVY